ncbi:MULTISPECIES: asparagine synthetase B [Nostoc]|uniref:asparagine synthase (glutamine-hydrolyzing) n=1 Tax=Nostoc paludosum FACHB-159 TaxID=2692908 RepID=A0ABR8K8H8_9NOSO|nr:MULTISPECIES: asparagine synthetase B family protein [Nostoc]MBD2676655.1 asparagine synthase [Nostoc sp. FACHB-857]MBD2735134.1 asparagine synthase [Nostoc paludosum FACHB-159]
MGNIPHHFLGYWGYGAQHQLEALLTGVLENLSPNLSPTRGEAFLPSITGKGGLGLSQFSQQENHLLPVWNVVYIGLDRNYSLLKNQIAGVSASGIFSSPDAWVSLEENNCLILGREPFGKMPLYWTVQAQVIWFATQLKLLLPILQQPDISIPGLYGYSCFSYVPTPLTPVNGVFAVPTGTELIWRDGLRPAFGDRNFNILQIPKSKNINSWRQAPEQLTDEATAIEELQVLLKNSIEQQIADLSDEPVGVFLSGGLDSSVVAALLVQAGVKVRAYTLDFGNAGIPEYPYAEQVAQFLKIPLVKVAAQPNDIKNALIPTVEALDLPFGDGVCVPLYLLSQRASQETQIIFNGEGGDQLFAGWTNKPLIAAGVYQSENPAGEETFIQQYLRTFHRLCGYESQVYQPEIYGKIQNLHPEDWLLTALDATECPSLLHRLRRASLMLKGAQNIHPRASALGLANGLWVRSPFCNLDLANWTFRLSGELCLQGACEKYILKRAVENWLPPEIVWRQKRGMGVPLTSWCLNDFWHQIGVWLNPEILRANNHFYPDIAAQIVEGKLGAAIQGRRIGEILWLLIMWQLWRSQFLNENFSKQSWNHPFWLPRWLWKNYKIIRNS